MTTDTEVWIISALNVLSIELHMNAMNKGFWDDVHQIKDIIREHTEQWPEGQKLTFRSRLDAMIMAEKIALEHSELSEALEAARKDPNAPDRDCPAFKAIEIERADAIIRILEVSRHEGHRIGEAIIAKHKFNQGRAFKHDKQF